MATRFPVPPGHVITASTAADLTGYIRQVQDQSIGSIVLPSTPITFGPYLIARDFDVSGPCTVAVDAITEQEPVVASLDPGGSAAGNGAILAAAVFAASRTGAVVRLPGGRYPMTCALTTGAIIEFAPDTVLLQERNAAALSIDLSADAVGPHTISAFSYGKHSSNAGASTNKFMRLTLGAGDAANYRVGDSIMVCSRDARTYYTGDTNYAGEMATVADVDTGNDYVYLDGALWLHGVSSAYTTTPVAYRLSRKTVRLIRPQVEANGDVYLTGLSGSWPGSIEIKAAARPVIENLRVNSAWGIGVYFKSAALARVTIDHIRDCPGDPANNRYGYGILFRGACNAPMVSGGLIERVRHGITTDCREAASWAVGNIWDHGDVTDMRVSGVTAVACGATAFDTHENSVNATFIGCTAIGGRYSPLGITGSTAYGFNLRGPWDKVIDGEVVDCEGGVNFAAPAIAHEILGENIVDGLTVTIEATNNLAGHGIVVSGASHAGAIQRISVRNLRPGKGSRGMIVESGFTGLITLENCIFRGWVDTQMRVQGSCLLYLVGCLFDHFATGSSELCISVDNSNTVTINLAATMLRSAGVNSPPALVTVASGATATVRYTGGCADLAGSVTALTSGAGTITETAMTGLT